MVAVIEDRLDAIAALCRTYGVVQLYVFGSALRDLFATEVDLVMTGAVKNPYVARDIERTKQVLYAA